MLFDLEVVEPESNGANERRVCEPGRAQRGRGIESHERQLDAKPGGQRGQGERQHESIVESIGEAEEGERREKYQVVPGIFQNSESHLDVRQLDREYETAEIKHVIEGQAWRRNATAGVRLAACEGVVEAPTENRRQCQQNRGIAQIGKRG